ncbi:hypothetical protein CPB85DRAFT_1272057 [Mucidula mucida]|nr:hypothetical protein CPB85DRAFT_1272057 [Mucidula mucida]
MRRRRANKSAKVPGVKLRPAQPQASTSKIASEPHVNERLWAEETQLGSEDSTYIDTCPRPFRDLVICATGIQDKRTLFKQAVDLGATTATSFTDRVTHLIADTHGSPKYKCAVEHRIPIMQPSWISVCHEVWLRGDDVDLNESVSQHRLPIFPGVVLSLSGIVDLATQLEIRKRLQENNGVFAEEVLRPVKVTHLLCSGDEETDKMKYAEKFNQRREANIQLVWEEWFWDSLEHGGRFEETAYQVHQPRTQRRSQPVEQPGSPSTSIIPAPTPKKSVLPGGDDEDEIASVKQVSDTSVKLWHSLLEHRGYTVNEQGKLVRSPNKKDQPVIPSPERPVSPSGGSILSKFQRTNSFAPVKEKMLQPFSTGAKSVSTSVPVASTKIFQGVRICSLGEAKSAAVKTAIEQAGGQMVAEDEADFILVRLVSGSKLYRAEADSELRMKFRTECWLEQSIYEDKICAPTSHISFVPLAIELPIPGTEKIQLSLSGLSASDSCFTRRLARALGLSLAPVFSRKATHLLCPSGTGQKYDKAQEWKIPVVNMGWLEEMSKKGHIPDVSPYLVGKDASVPEPDIVMFNGTTTVKEGLATRPQSPTRLIPEAGPGPSTTTFRLNGLLLKDPKGKAEADDSNAMMDITNDLQGPDTFVRELEACPQSFIGHPAVPTRSASIDYEEVPSSRTPSPMKLPSPMKMPPLLDMPKLQLLGKRRSEDSEERIEKRARPRAMRSNVLTFICRSVTIS